MTVIHRVTAIYRAVIYRFDCNRLENPNWQEADQLAIYKLD